MSRLEEMILRLIQDGMNPKTPPIGFGHGPDLPSLKGIGPMLCTKMTLLGGVVNGDEIVEFDPFLPYGFLHVESSQLQAPTVLAIINKVDFLNAVDLEDCLRRDDTFLTVEYEETPGLGGLMPKMFPIFEFTERWVRTSEMISRRHGLSRL